MKKLTKYEPYKRFNVKENGFYGSYYKPEIDNYQGKCLIVFGGSMGSFMLTELCAEKFYEAGLNVIAVAFRDCEGLPDELHDIPLETVGNCIKWAKENVADKVGVWGISLGGQLALTLGVYYKDYVSLVVAVNPMHYYQQGMTSLKKLEFLNCSCWTFNGKPLPYYSISVTSDEFKKQTKKDARKLHEFICYSEFYKREYENLDKTASYMIPVEEIKGSVLLLSAGEDRLLPSVDICNAVSARLEENGFKYPYKHITYDVESHYLTPAKPLTAKIFRVERKNPEMCDKNRLKSFNDTLEFIKNGW